jgi:hypothetical protein
MLIVEPKPGELGKSRISCHGIYCYLGEMIERFEEDPDPEYAIGPLSPVTDQT